MSYIGGGFQNYDASVNSVGATSKNPRRQSDSNPRRPSVGIDRPTTSDGHARDAHMLTGSAIDADGEAAEEVRRDEEVHKLARELTKKSTFSETDGANPLEAGPDSRLNPNSPNFNAKAWARALFDLQARTPDQNPIRTAGVAFRNLSAFGFGAESDYQSTVGNVWLRLAGGVRRLMGHKARRIDILRSFDGLVEAGEMLVVLGPPGSGCTTFLKTISGETHGFTVDKDSYINYQGKHSLTKNITDRQASAPSRCTRTSAARPSTRPRSTSTSRSSACATR
jgi:ABC-type glutathione transport system ATPase component